MNNTQYTKRNIVRINERIKASEIRVVGQDGENLGIMDTKVAIELAKEKGLDLIEISPNAKPPIAKITDYGKFQYDQKKKLSAQKAKAHTVEVKSIQIKVATGEHDLNLKAGRASVWLREGHRVKAELFLKGRTKYMEKAFLNERLERLLKLITEDYSIADGPKNNPKGIYVILEKNKSKKHEDE